MEMQAQQIHPIRTRGNGNLWS